ncbi:hypothetical protein ASZ90_003786 [hydrocarbon metagenome]|uniref:Uncharacterized protein n=1 Tax=hydrocarbon metagenome TaxID=938273 RepID=A0A0W8FZQ6_9ZZZZ
MYNLMVLFYKTSLLTRSRISLIQKIVVKLPASYNVPLLLFYLDSLYQSQDTIQKISNPLFLLLLYIVLGYSFFLIVNYEVMFSKLFKVKQDGVLTKVNCFQEFRLV